MTCRDNSTGYSTKREREMQTEKRRKDRMDRFRVR